MTLKYLEGKCISVTDVFNAFVVYPSLFPDYSVLVKQDQIMMVNFYEQLLFITGHGRSGMWLCATLVQVCLLVFIKHDCYCN